MTNIDEEVVSNYRGNYRISPSFQLTPALVQSHWDLERELRTLLLDSTPENRWETSERAYRHLYMLLRWHDEACLPDHEKDDYTKWVLSIGPNPQRVYEIGSGRGGLLKELVQHGYDCRGTEITQERGQAYLTEEPRISWGNTDGIHLDQFEPINTYDVVISNQVIEHLHPEDVKRHFESARRLLRSGGKYIFSTPHRFTGPHDLSLVFGLKDAEGMHLKEYTWGELSRIAKDAGFHVVYAATTARLSNKICRLTSLRGSERMIGTMYLRSLIAFESVISLIPNRRLQQSIAKIMRKAKLFSDNIFLVCS